MRPMMAMLLGGRNGAMVSISDTEVADVDTHPNGAAAIFTLESDGDLTTTPGSTIDWLLGSTTGSNYECRATVTDGTLSSGTSGSWLGLGSNRTWTVSRSSLGTKSCTFLLEIGLAGQNVALDSAFITLSATVET
jgi:hypothetical protein